MARKKRGPPPDGWEGRDDAGTSTALRTLGGVLDHLDGSRLDRLRDDELMALAAALSLHGAHLVAIVTELRDELVRRSALGGDKPGAG